MDVPFNTLIPAAAAVRLWPSRLILGALIIIGVVFPAVWSRDPVRRADAYQVLELLTEISSVPTPPAT